MLYLIVLCPSTNELQVVHLSSLYIKLNVVFQDIQDLLRGRILLSNQEKKLTGRGWQLA